MSQNVSRPRRKGASGAAAKARERRTQALRQREVVRLDLDGHTVAQIAERLNVTVRTIQRDLEAARLVWVADNAAMAATVKDRELVSLTRDELDARERLASIEREEHDAQSEIDRLNALGDEQSRKQASALLEALLRRDTHKAAKGWHEVLLKIRDRRAKLLGLDAPTKVETKIDAVVSDRRSALASLGDEDRKALSALAARAYAPRPAVAAAIASTNGNGSASHN